MINHQEQLIDIYDVWYKPFYQQIWFYQILFLIGLLGLCFVAWHIYKKYKNRPKKIDCLLSITFDLENLKKFHIVTEQDSKDCYFELSSIIKRYFVCRYDKIFEKLTDKEIVQKSHEYLSEGDIRLLQKIFQEMFHIKFDHGIVAREKFEQDIQLLQELIENTSRLEDIKEK